MNELPIQPKNNSKDLRNNIIVIALILILAVVLVLFFMQRKDHRKIVSEIRAEKDSIQMELLQIASGYDSLRTENDTINAQLQLAQTRVQDLLIEVEQTKKISYKQISGYQKQVTTLRGIMRDFVLQIDSLNKRNEILLAENTKVKEQFKQSEMKNEQLNQEKQQLQQNLKLAAMLEVRSLVAEPLNNRSKVTKFAKRTKKIRIYFILNSNVTAKRGAKNIYARIMRPDQLLLSKSSDNVFQFEDLKIPYSAMREINYEGLEIPVAIYWDNSDEPELMPGTYEINVFADGNEIGETTFEIK
ncbi:MAG: hypothetical protein CSA36_06650 [Draconibacterium sp.]|nr:MAG: hypothetical protein CSA36_06650 [Draconibacterium sp.]